MDMIWESFELLLILLLEMLEFWRILFKNLKVLHDEFLYDESLNSYHNQILMLARLENPSTYISTYKH